MKKPFLIIAWIALLAIGTFLRLDHLAERPFHADEATGARITAHRLESGNYVFDPSHYHGPTLSGTAMISATLAGQKTWATLEKTPLRLVPAIAGCLLILTPLLGRKRFGDPAMLVAALALATSPLLVYYSRMFIHEILLALFGLLALFQFTSAKRWWPAGLWIGLMFATKETFAISILAWSAAAALLYILTPNPTSPLRLIKQHWRPALATVALALLVSLAFYTNGFTRWQGAVDAVRTYFIYSTVEGHDKPFPYYLELLLVPRPLGGFWWFETPLLLAAAAALVASFVSNTMARTTRLAIRFLALAATFHFLIYSLIAYKTPWLMVLPWAQVCVLAGFSVTLLSRKKVILTASVAALLTATLVSQIIQSRHATGRFASDGRNPYAYVPTSDDIETLGPWLQSLDTAVPELPLEPIAMIGSEYWPLPWYLRRYQNVGYWPEPPASIERLPLIFATTDLSEALAATHVPVPRGLRSEVPMTVWVRHDFWDASLTSEDP